MKHLRYLSLIFGLVCLAFLLFFQITGQSDKASESRESEIASDDSERSTVPKTVASQTFKKNKAVESQELADSVAEKQLLEDAVEIESKRLPKGDNNTFVKRSLLQTSFKYQFVLREETWLDSPNLPVLKQTHYMVGDHILVRLPRNAKERQLKEWAEDNGYEIRSALRVKSPIYRISTTNPTTESVSQMIVAFNKLFKTHVDPSPHSSVAEPDYLVFPTVDPNDPEYYRLWGLHNSGQSGGTSDADVDAPESWDTTTGSSSVLVAVIDTGVDRSHPDLAANMWTNSGEIPNNGIDDDQNGFIDDLHGWDFFDDDNDPSDGGSHGTHVAGTIGAVGNNGIGLTGVCWNVSMVAQRFLGPTGGVTSDAIEAIFYSTSLGVDLTSNSWGGGGFSSLLESAIDDADSNGILFVAAAGNDATDNDVVPQYPANYLNPNIISVASSDDDDLMSSFSNYGRVSVDLAAPGSSIYSTEPGSTYGFKSGTSMATPHVSGALALMKSSVPGIPHTELKSILLESVDLVPAFQSTTTSGGRLNIDTVLDRLGGPFLNLQSSTLSEATSGNGDGLINPGEEFEVSIIVRNNGVDPASNAIARISVPTNSAFTVLKSEHVLGNVASGDEVSVTAAFRLTSDVAASTPLLETASIELVYDGAIQDFNQPLGLYTSSIVDGIVSNPSGQPISGATVSYSGSTSGEVITGSDGRYSITLEDGSYEIWASKSGFATADQVNITVPPSSSGVDFELGTPSIEVQPSLLSYGLNSGSSGTRSFRILNSGDSTLEWSIDSVLGANEVHLLQGGTIALPDLDGSVTDEFVTSEIAPLEASLANLTGVTVGHISTFDYGTFLSDLTSRGATEVSLTFPISASDLQAIRVLMIDDAIGSASLTDIATLRSWIQGGGRILVQGDNSASMVNINELIAGTGITESSRGFETVVISDFASHPTTQDITTMTQSLAGGICTISGDATAIAYESDGSIHAAVGRLGSGTVVVAGNEIASSSNFTNDDGRLFPNQVVDWLSAGADWLEFEVESGTIAAGASEFYDVTFDASGLDGGTYEAEVSFSSNDPFRPVAIMNVRLLVNGIPNMEHSPDQLLFSAVPIGTTTSLPLTFQNSGSEELQITSLTSSLGGVVITEPLPLLIPPRSEQVVDVFFTPDVVGAFNGSLTISSNDPETPSIILPVQGVGLDAPLISFSPALLSTTLGFGQSTSEIIQIHNNGGAELTWSVSVAPRDLAASANGFEIGSEIIDQSQIFTGSGVVPKNAPIDKSRGLFISQAGSQYHQSDFQPSSNSDLAEVLLNFDENFATLTDLIPERFDFSDGVSGTSILDGGSDMYDGGNYLETNVSGGFIAYSDGVIAANGASSYFTRKVPGLFFFAADLSGASYFEISGNLGADGGGSVDGAVIQHTRQGKSYTGFIKRVYNTSDPSINHLILVESDGQTHEFSTDTNNDFHRVNGLSNQTRIYYFLFASRSASNIGTRIDDSVYQDFVSTFLDTISDGTEWLVPETFSGTVAPGQASSLDLGMDAFGLEQGLHQADLVFASNAGSSPDILPINLTVQEPEFESDINEIDLTVAQGVNPSNQTISLTSLTSTAAWTASTDTPWISLSNTSGTLTDGTSTTLNPEVGFDLSMLPPGIHNGSIVISTSNTTRVIEVSITIEGVRMVELLTDYKRPYVYGVIWEEGDANSRLVRIDPHTLNFLDSLSLPPNITDIELDLTGDQLYAISFANNSITRVDLDAFTINSMRIVSLPVPTSSATHVHVAPGASGIVYVVDGTYSPDLHIYDFENGILLGSELIGILDFRLSPDGSAAYLGTQGYWSTYGVTSTLRKYDVSSNPSTLLESDNSSVGLGVDVPLFVSPDQKFAILGEEKRSLQPMGSLVVSYPESIYGMSYYGDLAVGQNSIYNGSTGDFISSLPGSAKVMAFSGDQTRLLFLNESTNYIQGIDVASISVLPIPGVAPIFPEPDTVINAENSQLSWTAAPVTARYDIYLGTNLSDVTNAGLSSPQYLGRSTDTSWDPSDFVLDRGTQYFWRVDQVSIDGTSTTGAVWGFETSPLQISPGLISVRGVNAPYQTSTTIQLASDGALSWSAYEEEDWLSISLSSGTSPETLEVTVDFTSLLPGDYTSKITFFDGSADIELPIEVKVDELELVKMTTDLKSPYVYGLHQNSEDRSSFLLWLNTDSLQIDQVLPVGNYASDLTVHYPEDRIYVSNWGSSETRVIDRTTRQELPSINLGTDVFILNAGVAGRLFTEEEGGYVRIDSWDISSNSNLANTTLYEGDGEVSRDGSFYFHAESSIYGAHITKFDVSAGTFTNVAEGPESGYGSRKLVLSGDGRSLFWQEHGYDPNTLNRVRVYPDEVHSVSFYGEFVAGEYYVYNSLGEEVGSLPARSTVSAFSSDNQTLVFFNHASHSIEYQSTSIYGSLPEPDLTPDFPEDGGVVSGDVNELTWTTPPLALSFDLYIGTDEQSVTAADRTSGEFVSSVNSNSFSLDQSLTGGTYYWRIDAIGTDGLISSRVWSFSVSDLIVSKSAIDTISFLSRSLSNRTIELDSNSPTNWTASENASWLTLGATSGTTPATLDVGIDTSNLAEGDYLENIELSGGSGSVPLSIPVSVKVSEMDITVMISDPSSTMVYAIHEESDSLNSGYLLSLDGETNTIVDSLPVGFDILDMTVNRFENRLYILEGGTSSVKVFDLNTFEQLPPLYLDSDATIIDAGRMGRLYTLDTSSYGSLKAWDSSSGDEVDSFYLGQYRGRAAVAPDGLSYFHGEGTFSSNDLVKIDISTDAISEISSVARSTFSSEQMFMSPNGAKIFWLGGVFDSDLNFLHSYLDPNGAAIESIYATTDDGVVAVSESRILVDTGVTIQNLPVNSTIMAVPASLSKLLYFDSASADIFDLNIDRLPYISSSLNVVADVGVPVQYQVSTVFAATSISVTGLPNGLTFDSVLGVISGTPMQGGIFPVTISATNAEGTDTKVVEFKVQEPAQLPFFEDFESGVLGAHWAVSGTNDFRTQITSEHSPYEGANHLTMDDTQVSSAYARNELTLSIDLANTGNRDLKFSFRAKEFGDEIHALPSNPFIGGADFDGVAISSDGSTWYEVQPLQNEISADWSLFEIDLDEVIDFYALSRNSDFKIRFNQYDNYSITTDGFAFDNISVTAIEPQVIDFAAIPDLYELDSFTLQATGGSSGNPVVFEVTSGPAVLSNGNQLSFTGSGPVTITASQAGSDTHEAAIDVTRTFNVLSALNLFEAAALAAGLQGDDSLPDATPFNDGITNLQRYAFNLPLDSASSQVLPEGGNAGFPRLYMQEIAGQMSWNLKYLRRIDSGIIYTPMSASTFDGTYEAVNGSLQVSQIDSSWERVTFSGPANIDKQFFRVNVSLPVAPVIIYQNNFDDFSDLNDFIPIGNFQIVNGQLAVLGNSDAVLELGSLANYSPVLSANSDTICFGFNIAVESNVGGFNGGFDASLSSDLQNPVVPGVVGYGLRGGSLVADRTTFGYYNSFQGLQHIFIDEPNGIPDFPLLGTVRINYTPSTNAWNLYMHSGPEYLDPMSLDQSNLRGSAVNSENTNVPLPYFILGALIDGQVRYDNLIIYSIPGQ